VKIGEQIEEVGHAEQGRVVVEEDEVGLVGADPLVEDQATDARVLQEALHAVFVDEFVLYLPEVFSQEVVYSVGCVVYYCKAGVGRVVVVGLQVEPG